MPKRSPPEITVRYAHTARLLWQSDGGRFGTGLLDERELDVADRLRDDRIRHDYVAAHVLARLTLADATGARPAAIRFKRTRTGRPAIAHPRSARHLRFSLSHADGVAICAVAPAPIGADVEYVAGMVDPDGLADTICSPDERAALLKLNVWAQRDQLLRLWTCKEAIAKADGRGVRLPFAAIHTNGAFAAIVGDPRQWLVASIWVTPLHMATVVVGAHDRNDEQLAFEELR
jgi:4'-phosphopantetheinyl transferase